MKVLFLALVLALIITPVFAAENNLDQNQKELANKEQELADLEKKIEELKGKQQTATNQAELAAEQVAKVSRQLQTAELQLERTLLALSLNQSESEKIARQIQELHGQVEDSRTRLRATIRSLYQYDQVSLIDLVLSSDNLGIVITQQRTYHELQKRTMKLIQELRDSQQQLEQRQQDLAERQKELDELRGLQARQQGDLSLQRQEKKNFLNLKQEQQAEYQHLVTEALAARREIEQQVFTLQSVGLQLALGDVFDAARYASGLTGVRPALLLAIIKVETNVGEYLGSGTFPDDMHPASRDAFLRLTARLGLDPYNTPISRRPVSYQGWGGAIGPGQFLPDTWERLELRLQALMNKQPDPFALPDSLVAIGVMMADRGATDPNKELEAVSRFLAGPNWQYHTWYGKRVLAVAEEYAKEGL
ncbi:MAG: hypothetical protein ABIH36_03130 [bacterium]